MPRLLLPASCFVLCLSLIGCSAESSQSTKEANRSENTSKIKNPSKPETLEGVTIKMMARTGNCMPTPAPDKNTCAIVPWSEPVEYYIVSAEIDHPSRSQAVHKGTITGIAEIELKPGTYQICKVGIQNDDCTSYGDTDQSFFVVTKGNISEYTFVINFATD